MSKQLLNVSLGAGLLLIVPLVTLIFGWQWDPQRTSLTAYPFYLLTQTVTRPWGIMTSLVLGTLLYSASRSSMQSRAAWALLIVVVVGGGQGIKSLLKPYFAEPRPYVVKLTNELHVAPSVFYQQSKVERQALITQSSAFWPLIPGWQRTHWQHETGYSFPSGHSFFVASWLLLFYGLVSLRRYWPVLIIVTLWAWSVMWSRMLLGMHWPRDLIASVSIAWVFTLLVLFVYRRLCSRK
ncbi:phosphatase PAP2 family protein [Rosenbergiella collisarenosi]|uniref:phosphatase PAP2 family protein n=1 Tax=Rosenbergiella collisarenosi TaxID=1544695 RepID=UPI001F4FD3FA|nr:phosphatase PAP2 family protein [Rosenbergiella collisarenosi]